MIISAGQTNVGTTTGNTIGSTSGTSITINLTATSGGGAIITGIATTGGTPHTINNNTIAGITVSASTATVYGNLYAISLGASSSVTTVDGNTIGSSSGQINNNSGSGTVSIQYVTAGIRATTGSETTGLTFNNNIIQYLNMPAGASNTGATLYGMQLTSTGTVYTITNNTIRNLTTGSARTTGLTSASLAGIMHQGTTAPVIIRGNTIHSLSQSAASAAVYAYGIYCTGSTSGNHELSGNNIHSISLATTSTSAILEGVYLAGGVYRVFNNMIRIGIDKDGNSVGGNFSISGLRKASTNAHTYVFNSIYVGGSVASSSTNTFAFRRTSQNAADSIFNNIFVNNRSNTSGTAKHYAISTITIATGVENFNLFYANGTGGAVGSVDGGTTAQTTLLNYQTAFAGRNGNSAYGDPNYVNATGNASAVDLHVQNPTPIEGQGSTAFNYITTDFDGATRSSLTPVDIGADAGNFTLADIFPPAITYTALSNTASTLNRTLASVTITDATGVPTSGTLQPRIWFRRSAPTSTSWGSTQGTLSSGSGTSGVWSFTIDYSVIGVTPASGETYQYYIVAQDEATTPNIATNPAGGVHTDVNTQTSAPTTPNSYSILSGFTGTYNVGTGETYTTFTGVGGLFQALNGGVLTGNVTALITSDITEDGTNGLNQLVSDGGSFTFSIQPSEAVEKVISGAVTNGLIRLNGADNVTIDGRYSGSGKYLRFRNTNTSNPTLTFINDASNNLVRDCYIEGATTSTTNGVVFFTTGSTTGNDNNTIQNCVIRDRSDVAGVPANLVYSQGTSSTVSNSGNSISGCTLFNFTSNGIFTVSTNAANDGWSITNNEIYQEAARTTELTGIRFNSEGTSNTISGNIIRDLNTSSVVNGIYLDNVAKVNIFKNKIYNIPSTNGSTATLYGIYIFGYSSNFRGYIYNNQITIIPSFTNAQTIYGIREWGDSNDSTYIYYNSVYVGGTGSGSSKTYAYDDNNTSTHNVVYNNAFVNVRSGGTGGHFAARHTGTSSITSTNSKNNLYIGNGPTAGNNFELSTTASSFSAWKAAFTGEGKDAYSYSINSSDVTIANLFSDPTTGNLNIINTNEECWLVNGKGIAISGIADDFGATGVRSTTSGAATDIGSDEFTPSGGGSTPPAANASGSPAPSTTTTYTISGNTNGSIAWGAGGTVPTSIDFRYYSGVQPAGGGSAPKANFYWDITPTGGSGYSYDIVLTYDEDQLNGIAENKLHPAKSTDGGTTWSGYVTEGTDPGQFQRNTTNNTITIYGLTSFSLFGLGDLDNPLPVELTSFNANVKNRDVVLSWSTATEVNSCQFEIERAEKNTGKPSDEAKWQKINALNAAGNSNSSRDYSYTDQKLNSGIYMYRLKMLDNDGTFAYSNVIEAEVSLPKDFMLGQNYPNPFNPSTKIDYQLPQNSVVKLELYNISGERIAVLLNEEKEAGYHAYQLNSRLLGQELATGVYIYRLSASSLESETKYNSVKKLMIVK